MSAKQKPVFERKAFEVWVGHEIDFYKSIHGQDRQLGISEGLSMVRDHLRECGNCVHLVSKRRSRSGAAGTAR